MSTQRSGRRRRKNEVPHRRRAIVHDNVVLVRMSDAGQLEQLLVRADVRNRLVRQLDERTCLVSGAGLATLRKRLAALGLNDTLVVPGKHMVPGKHSG